MSRPATEKSAHQFPLVLTLRVLGTIDMLAFVAVVMPRTWIAATHEWAGLGEFPDAVVASYLARSASLLYGFYGVLLWYLAGDVERYWNLITFIARVAMVLGVMLFIIDWIEDMPTWWRVVEGPAFAAAGVLMLAAQRSCRPR